MIRFGAPVFVGSNSPGGAGQSHGAGVEIDPGDLVEAHKRKGYRAAYAPRVDLEDTDRIRATRRVFADADILIAEVGYWENLLDTDADTRKVHRERMTRALATAEELGARCAINILGSYCHGNGNSAHHADNFADEHGFADAVDLARSIIDAVRPKTAYFVYEIFPFNVVDSPLSAELERAASERVSPVWFGRWIGSSSGYTWIWST